MRHPSSLLIYKMKRHGLEKLGFEILELLWSYYLLRQETKVSDDPVLNLRSMKIIQLLQNDIILRLCKFRDKDSRSLSFDQLLKQEKKSNNNSRLKTLTDQVKKYRDLTKNIENHREAYVAHLSKRGNEHLKPLAELQGAIKLALDLTDCFWGEENQYEIGGVDLRIALNKNNAA